MSDHTELPPRTHNLPPVVAPTDEAMLADLKNRYPKIDEDLADFEAALKTFPDKLTLEDEETAAALQDLLGKMAKHKRHWASDRKDEKSPWDKMVKVVQNFFGRAEEKVDGWLEVWKPRHQAFLDLKAADARRKAEEEAERQRAESERLRKEAEAAEQRRLEAIRAEEEARRKEAEARQRAEDEERRRREAEAAADRARAEEKRLADEKRARDKAEKETIGIGLREIHRHMKEAKRLHDLAETMEATEAESERLDALVRPGGTISEIAGPVSNSHLLDDEQKADVTNVRLQLVEMRTAINARHDAKERKRRMKAQAEAEAKEKAHAEERRVAREAEQKEYDRIKAEREAAESAAEAAKAAEKAAKGDAREARQDAASAASTQKAAGKDVKAASTDADRAENRADRMDRRIEGSTDADFGRLRGELGTVGSNSGRYERHIIDEAKLRKTLGPLGAHFTTSALEGATYQWMSAHRGSWDAERIEDPSLPGVIFTWERDSKIAGG